MGYIIGINAYHGDSSACILSNGKLIAAAEEERFRRVKHWTGFPSEAIKYCLSEAGISISEVEHIAVNRNPKANLLKKILFTVRNRPNLGLILDRVRNAKDYSTLEEALSQAFPAESIHAKVHNIEHHFAHLASAYYVSPFKEAVVVSIDGMGDFASAAWGVGKGAELRLEEKVHFPHSLGIFYQALTQFLGFPNYGDEYKVMGLAPLGEPNYLEQMREIVLLQGNGTFSLNMDYFTFHKQRIAYDKEGEPLVELLFSDKLTELLGPARQKSDELTQKHKDIARSVQVMYEEAFFNLLNSLHVRYKIDAICLAGGCAMNSVANGKIRRKTPFRHVYVQSAAGDAGGAIGSAYAVWHSLGGGRDFVMSHSYWGPSFESSVIRQLLDEHREKLESQGCQVRHVDSEAELCDMTASSIAVGKVVGWFQGRMEWGPRALGNRSILGDPRRADMKDILNLKIKRRESFRPFAPSIVREEVASWFEEEDEVPFMMQVFQFQQGKKEVVPAVVHVDGSGRLQTVRKEANPRYWALIRSFAQKTGVPMLLNTSFNENEPVVCRPVEALDCFLRTKMDVLVLGDYFIERSPCEL